MPFPVLANLWACNPWNRELEREVQVDTGIHAVRFKQTAQEIDWHPLPPAKAGGFGEGEHVYSTEEWYTSLTQDWPEVEPVIEAADYVSGSDRLDVLDFRNSKVATEAEKAKDLECYNFADYQLDVAGFGTTARPSFDDKNYQVLLETPYEGGVLDVVQVAEAVDAVRHFKEQLPRGRPIMIGVRLNDWGKRPNDLKSTPLIEPTNHFLVAVGMGQDEEGYYISFYDYLQRPSDEDRLYLRRNLEITTRGDERNLVQVRRSWRKRSDD